MVLIDRPAFQRIWQYELLPILALSFLTILIGSVFLTCLIGTLSLLYLLQRHWRLQRATGIRADDANAASPLTSLALGCFAALAQLTTGLHRHMAEAAGVLSGITSLRNSDFKEAEFILALGVLAYLSGRFSPSERFQSAATSVLKIFSAFALITNLSVFVAGLWGRVAFLAAAGAVHAPTETFQGLFSSNYPDILTGMTVQRDAAFSLYREQNQYVFYAMFLVIPLVWLLVDVHRWSKAKPFKWGDPAGRGWIACSFLVVAVGSVAVLSGAIWRYPTVMVLGAFGEPRDRAMAFCLFGAKESQSEMGCLTPWEQGWRSELGTVLADVRGRLSPAVRKRFEIDQARWQGTFVDGLRPDDDSPKERFRLLFNRGTNIRNRTRLIRKAAQEPR